MTMEHNIHHPFLTSGLLLAGLFPMVMNLSTVFTFLYYMILIPPALFQCYKVCKEHFIPVIRSWFSKDST